VPESRRPTGPGQPRQERRDAVAEREEIDELAVERNDDAAQHINPVSGARHAERDAHTPAGKERRQRR